MNVETKDGVSDITRESRRKSACLLVEEEIDRAKKKNITDKENNDKTRVR